ncbi:MAG: beta-lactamase family protein [Salinibacterium sp.]|nr:beta-lactamase family protein [Salinibacterium sp.]
MRPSRRITQCLLVGAALSALLAGCATAPPQAVAAPTRAVVSGPTNLRMFAEQSRLSGEAIADLVPSTQPGCSAAVGKVGIVVWAAAAGLADHAAGIPVTTETRFDIASVSKQFTATAILMLQRDGLISLSDPISDYVDDLPWWGAEVTLDQLMHHTSRIPDYWVELDDIGIGFTEPADQQVTVDAIRREQALVPGTGFDYSNSNYVLLAEVVGRVSGLPLPEFLAERIFAPLGLDMVLAPTLHAPDIALSYDDDLSLQEAGWTSYGHTGIITTPSELVRWGDQYRTGDIIQDDFDSGAVLQDDGELYAAGMNIQEDGDLAHKGRMGGFISAFTVSADRETVIAVMCNGHLSNRNGISDRLWAIWDPHSAE